MADLLPSVPVYDRNDFASAFMALLPFGPVWPRDQDAVLPQVAAALVPTYERMTFRAAALLTEAPMYTLTEMLPEWEATLGLPDPCAGPEPTIELRRQGVAAAIAARGGQSIPYFTAIAFLLGSVIQVEEFTPFQADVSGADDPDCEPGWAHVWWVGRHGENLPMECTLRRYAPAHTRLEFVDLGGFALWDFGIFGLDLWAA